MTTIFAILTLTVFIGGAFVVCKAGQKDGICKYGQQVGEDDANVQD